MTTWLITGASRGIGRLLTEVALERGHTVAATMRKPEEFAVDDSSRGRLWKAPLDVTDPAQVRSTVTEAFSELGHIDVVVSNAGYGLYGATEELADGQVRQIVETNLIGSITVARAALPHLRVQGGGRFLQLSSMAGHFSRPGFSMYHATKWGIEGFFEAFAAEVAAFGIRTTIVAPGRFPTSFYESAQRTEALEPYVADERIARQPGSADDMPGDVRKLVEAIMDLAVHPDPPLRLLLGSDALENAREALTVRLRDLEAQADLAKSTDRSR